MNNDANLSTQTPQNAVIIRENFSLMHGAAHVDELVNQIELIQQVMQRTMIKGEHYGIIPGCRDKKPSLLKPGAEKLSFVFRLAPEFLIETRDMENGHREEKVTCTMRQIHTGLALGQGVGSCTTMEAKYRYRSGPKESTGKPVPSQYWDFRKSDPAKAQELLGGKGFTIGKNDAGGWEIMRQGEKVDHDNPADHYNTVLKMAKKRAHVDAVLTVTSASDLFTQDVEDIVANKRAAGEMPADEDGESNGNGDGHSNGNGNSHTQEARNTKPVNGNHAEPKRQNTPAPSQASDNDGGNVQEAKNWRGVEIHFGRQKDMALGAIDQKSLEWWVEKWAPRPYPEGSKVFKANDMFLRQALDAAAVELGLATPPKATAAAA